MRRTITAITAVILAACACLLLNASCNTTHTGEDGRNDTVVIQDTVTARFNKAGELEFDPNPDVLVVSASQRSVVRVLVENQMREPVSQPGSAEHHYLHYLRHLFSGHGLSDGTLIRLGGGPEFFPPEYHVTIQPAGMFEHRIKVPFQKMQVGSKYELLLSYADAYHSKPTYRLLIVP